MASSSGVRVTFVRYNVIRYGGVGATLFSKVDLTKLRYNVHNEVTLICAKFGADLITISKDTDHKTKWPRFLAYPVHWL